MKKTKLVLKTFVLFLVVTLIFNINVFGQSQGPSAPEAASFEPVDATDMVNLSTGDLTYVLPLLNIPSPEGGYPIALAYHGGIAMDQEATWTGLGWNLNAGAINRSINGYPDDYNATLINEYFYDEGEEISIYSVSLGYSNGAASVGLGLSWGSNKSLGGYVSIGVGFQIDGVANIGVKAQIGTEGASIGINSTVGGLSLGINANSEGKITASVGIKNDAGFNLNYNTSGGLSASWGNTITIDKDGASVSPLGITLSSKGLSINTTVKGVGVGLSLQFENTVQMGDYITQSSSFTIPLVIPTPIGIFSLSFGKQTYKYYLAKNENNFVTGPIYYSRNVTNNIIYNVGCSGENYYGERVSCGSATTDDWNKAIRIKASIEAKSNTPDCRCAIDVIGKEDAFMDVYELPLNGKTDLSLTSQIIKNNPTFPSYDYYNVQAQGLSGGMSSHLFDNGALFGLTGRENEDHLKLKYAIDGTSTTIPNHAQFTQKPHFYFDNEISTYLGVTDVKEATFKTGNLSSILSYYNGGVETKAKPRRKNANYIEYFTNDEINNNYTAIKSKGFLLPSGTGFNRKTKPKDGIGAFKITSIDGKTYHYSLPVYNHEIITRTFGFKDKRPSERQSYQEKRQLESYATHWLLTAITGPDYYDTNNNGKVDKADYGYWLAFDYGKWTDAFVWKNPYGKYYFENQINKKIKTWIRGRKELYYLDKIKSRSHTAFFIKSERHDGHSTNWSYFSVNHVDGLRRQTAIKDYRLRFTIPSQAPLKLDKIILVKNEYENLLTKSSGISNERFVDVHYNNSNKKEKAYYNLKDSVFDLGDNYRNLLNKASKVIDLTYKAPSTSLVKGTPNTNNSSFGRLTLESVSFKGKKNAAVLPPYKFEYNNNTSYTFNIKDKDEFGYKSNDNSLWSLKKIVTPQGGQILIDYQTHTFKTVINSNINFRENDKDFSVKKDPNYSNAFILESTHDIGMKVGDKLLGRFDFSCNLSDKSHYCSGAYDRKGVAVTGTIKEKLGNNKFRIYLIYPLPFCYNYYANDKSSVCRISYFRFIYNIINKISDFGGIRVASITTTDGKNNYVTNYKYGENEDGVGHISYLPYAPELQEELPYSAELPAPKVMYEYVTMETKNAKNQSDGKTRYKFKVFKEKDPNSIKFGDLYEINITENKFTNTSQNKEVNISSYTIKDNLATLGSLLEVVSFNSEGQLMSKIQNEYYAPEQTPNKLGMTKESYQTYKTADYTDARKQDKWLINASTRIKYPSFLKSSTEYKFNSQYTTEFNVLNNITGKSRELLSYNSDGIKLKTKTVFAYDKYAGMGSKVDDINNVNMLSQETASYTYLIDPVTNTEKVMGAAISTWNNNWKYRDHTGKENTPTDAKQKVWRKHQSFAWKGAIDTDGAYVGFNKTNDDNFNWGLGATQTNSKWQKTSETTRYDHYSSTLEVTDINQNYAASKKGDNHSKVIVTSNAKYTEMFYSGAEYTVKNANGSETGYFDGEVKATGRTKSTTAHTGNYVVALSTGQKGFGVTIPADIHRNTERRKRFKVSVWVRTSQKNNVRVVVNGRVLSFVTNESQTAGTWTLMNGYITVPATATTVAITCAGGGVDVDDFRLHPITSSMMSYVYNEWDEVWYIIGNNGLATRYEYDSQGKLEKTWAEVIDNPVGGITGGFKKMSTNSYNYKK